AGKVGEWLAVSGMHDVTQDERMEQLIQHAHDDFPSRLALLRIVSARKRGASVQLLKSFLSDEDERLMRMATREIIRRRPAEFENTLLQVTTSEPDWLRRVVSRSTGPVGFETSWH